MKKITIADLFCGAGGTSTGAIHACRDAGVDVELTAINHWQVAVNTHTANHPGARHLCASLDSLNPTHLFKSGELDMLWGSPECTHHSVARGGKPINDQSRATAWCIVRWAEALRPKVILVENVPEFETWGPIGSNNRPLASRRGATFMAWVGALESIGYRVDWRVLCAADYGDPTTRRRLFVQAVLGRRQIVWPEQTHCQNGDDDLLGNRKPWVSAKEIIDWSIPGASIFERNRPLAPRTIERINAGLKKFAGPFVVQLRGGESSHIKNSLPTTSPLPTITANGKHLALCQPFIVTMEHRGSTRPITKPLPTITTAKGGAMALVEPFVLGQHSCSAPRSTSDPLPTVTTDGAIALIEPFIVKYFGTGGAVSVKDPLDSVTTKGRFGLVRPVVNIQGEQYIMDIRFRMLQTHELAAAQGFPKDYIFTGTKTDAVKQIGNAVPTGLARALVSAQLHQM